MEDEHEILGFTVSVSQPNSKKKLQWSVNADLASLSRGLGLGTFKPEGYHNEIQYLPTRKCHKRSSP